MTLKTTRVAGGLEGWLADWLAGWLAGWLAAGWVMAGWRASPTVNGRADRQTSSSVNGRADRQGRHRSRQLTDGPVKALPIDGDRVS